MKENIKYLIKTIIWKHPKVVRLESNGENKEFKLDYDASKKVAKLINREYYFGTELRYRSQQEYLKTFKELLRVKRALKQLK
ncbi:hypothetical protein COE51_01405 [Bacillus pseudomycoides]|nr:hypothetical protein COE51_01405 [Bacillus pseudomycoides]